MHTPTGTLLRLAALVCTALLVASGCADEPPQAGTIPSDSPSATSTSATPQTPEEQIEATMVAYFDATNEAFRSGDVSELREFSTSGCPCRKAADDIEQTVASGGRFEDLRYHVTSIQVHALERATAQAEVRAKVPPYKVYNAQGKVTEDSDGGNLHTDFSLVKHGDRWIIGNALNLGGAS